MKMGAHVRLSVCRTKSSFQVNPTNIYYTRRRSMRYTKSRVERECLLCGDTGLAKSYNELVAGTTWLNALKDWKREVVMFRVDNVVDVFI